ncbi:MAG TPA: hypothetical protein VFW33_13150 [Gemmataceae bacterium]|nr:hypothetical protein [Gemmataceae bacterium]
MSATAPTQALTGEEADLLTAAVNAIKRGRAELLLSYVLAGYCCRGFVLGQVARGLLRASAIAKLRAVLAPEAETKLEGDPASLIRLYESLNLLSGGEAEKWVRSRDKEGCRPPAFAAALGVAKAQALSPLVVQYVGADGLMFARDDADGARAIFAWACGPDLPLLADVQQRVNYYLDPAKGREFELSHRLADCKTAEDYDAVIEWARALGPRAVLRDDRSVLDAAVQAKERIFPTEDHGEEAGEEDGLEEQPGNFLTGDGPELELARAEDPAPALTAVITHHRAPDDVFARLLKLLVASGDLSDKARRAASAALVIISRAEKSRRSDRGRAAS